MKVCFPLALGVGLLAGCTQPSDSGPIRVGLDTYTIETRAATFNGAPANTAALREASDYCASIHRNMLLDRMQGSEASAQIYFFCLAPDDPRMVQQHMHTVPPSEASAYSLPTTTPPQPAPQPAPFVEQPQPPPPVVPQAVIVPHPEPDPNEVVQAPERHRTTSHRAAKPMRASASEGDLDHEMRQLRMKEQAASPTTPPPFGAASTP